MSSCNDAVRQSSIRHEFARYIVVGGVAFAADFLTLGTLAVGFGMHYLAATLLAFLVGTWVNYGLSTRWVFMYRAVEQRGVEFGLFLMVGVITLGLSLTLMVLLVEILMMNIFVAKCVVTAFTLLVNFTGRRALLFTRWWSGRNDKVYAQTDLAG
jgi:putative flippase GtrA